MPAPVAGFVLLSTDRAPITLRPQAKGVQDMGPGLLKHGCMSPGPARLRRADARSVLSGLGACGEAPWLDSAAGFPSTKG